MSSMLAFFRFVRPRPRKRKHDPDATQDGQEERAYKRMALEHGIADLDDDHGQTTGRQIRAREVIDLEDNQEERAETPQRLPREILIIEDDDNPQTKGTGSEQDPITLIDWTTGNIILPDDNGACYVIPDDDDVEDGDRHCSDNGDDEHDHDYHDHHFDNDNGNDDVDDDISYPRYNTLSPSWLIMASPSPEAPSQDDNVWTSPSSCRTPSTPLVVMGGEREQSPNDDEILILDDDVDYTYSQDWSTVKREIEEQNPDIGLSKGRGDGFALRTPRPCQTSGIDGSGRCLDGRSRVDDDGLTKDSELLPITPQKAGKSGTKRRVILTEEQKRVRRLDLVNRKTLFYFKHGPRNLRLLRERVARFRQDHAETKGEQECWLYSGAVRRGQRTLSINVRFHDEANPSKTLEYSVNAGYVSMMVDGLMTEEYKKGIIQHAWHASHLCGNWTCTNPRHIVAEAGLVNVDRNWCFHGKKQSCTHSPRCMTHLRIEPQPGTLEHVQAQQRSQPEREVVGDWPY